MADESESLQSIVERVRDQGSNFEHMQDQTDNKVNDGNNYRGLMNPKDYAAKRLQVAKDDEEVRKEKEDAIRAKIKADRAAKQQADDARQEREAARREKLQRELNKDESQEEQQPDKKKRKKKASGPVLSFDVED